MITKTFGITGMHCNSCAMLIKEEIESLSGVASAAVDSVKNRAVVTFDPESVTETQICDAVAAAGYSAATL